MGSTPTLVALTLFPWKEAWFSRVDSDRGLLLENRRTGETLKCRKRLDISQCSRRGAETRETGAVDTSLWFYARVKFYLTYSLGSRSSQSSNSFWRLVHRKCSADLSCRPFSNPALTATKEITFRHFDRVSYLSLLETDQISGKRVKRAFMETSLRQTPLKK